MQVRSASTATSPSTSAQDFGLDFALCQRALVTGVDETGAPLTSTASSTRPTAAQATAVAAGMAEVAHSARLVGKQVIIVAGRSDALVPVNHNARAYTASKYPPHAQPLWTGERYRHDRIRVAYLSADFHDHATAYLMAELFELHDHASFEIHVFSFGVDKSGAMRQRLSNAVTRFYDVNAASDAQIATMLRQQEIDIAIDLKGFTQHSRSAIFSYRAAPVQVNYLGYPGTMGAPYIDYIIADRHIIPAEDDCYYQEKVVRLPDSYQVNDSKRVIADDTPSRAELGLPANGFVFCSFNNHYKITPDVFAVWMRLLARVPGSVLWQLCDNPLAITNLQQQAQLHGIDPVRLVFAGRMSSPLHLARQRLADLFLDTLPCNAHTTASDALWMGLPLLTCQGDAFVGRVASSCASAS